VVNRNNPALRRPNWFERWLYRDRFPTLAACLAAAKAQALSSDPRQTLAK